jgi:hypothetical protein
MSIRVFLTSMLSAGQALDRLDPNVDTSCEERTFLVRRAEVALLRIEISWGSFRTSGLNGAREEGSKGMTRPAE